MKKFVVLIFGCTIMFLVFAANAYAAACDSYYCDNKFIVDNAAEVGDLDIFVSLSPTKITGTAWTSYNDGAFSGLDADKLDGKHASDFADDYHSHSGYARSIHWHPEDASVDHEHLNLGVSTDFTSGLYVNDNAYEVDNKDIRKNSIRPVKIYGRAWTRKNDGPGSGLNADMLDGYHVQKLLDEIASLNARVAALEAK